MSEQNKAHTMTAEQLNDASAMSDFDRAILGGNYTAINAELEAEAAKQGIDLKQPRDDKGRFVAIEKPNQTEPESEPDEPITYKMTVEVAPGHSIEVEADSKEACQLKADLAQKVAQLAIEAAKPKVEPQPQPTPALTSDEAFELGTKLQSGKVEAIDEYLEKNPTVFERFLEKKGVKVDELKEIVQERKSTREVKSWEDATAAFKEAHPDYVPSDLGRDLMGYKLAELGLGSRPSVESLEQAYEAVKTKYPQVFTQKSEAVEPTPQQPAPVVKKKATSSTMFGVGGGGDTRPSKLDPSKVRVNLTPEQFASMNPEQLAAWYNAQMEEITGQKRPF